MDIFFQGDVLSSPRKGKGLPSRIG
ncbi:hypothetical protein LINPERPRIM_LOCUS25580 [Linum perenne]